MSPGVQGFASPARPRSPTPGIAEEVRAEDIEGRLNALENLAVTHATFLQQVHCDIVEVKQIVKDMQLKVVTLDTYAETVDGRITQTEREFATHIEQRIATTRD